MSKINEEQRRWLADELRKRGRGAKSELATRLGLRKEAITRILTAKDDRGYREVSLEELLKAADFFGSTPPGLLIKNSEQRGNVTDASETGRETSGNPEDATSSIAKSATRLSPESIIPLAELVGNRDLPVFGCSHSDRGVAVLSISAVEYTARPEPLLKVPDGYGVIVPDDSMSPEHGIGSTALVHPHLPPQVGDTCIFRRINADDKTEILIRILTRITPTTWHVGRHEPADIVALKRFDWRSCHVTVGNYKRR